MFKEMLFFPFLGAFTLLWLVLSIVVLVFWIWMIVDCVKRKFRNDVEKVVWVVVMIFTSWVGALAYFIIIRSLNPRGLAK